MYGMLALSFWSASILTGLSIAMVFRLIMHSEGLEIWSFMVFMMVIFLCIGFLFGNLNAIAMELLGHIVGIVAAVIGVLSSLKYFPISTLTVRNFDGTIIPLSTGFSICGVAMIVSILWANQGEDRVK